MDHKVFVISKAPLPSPLVSTPLAHGTSTSSANAVCFWDKSLSSSVFMSNSALRRDRSESSLKEVVTGRASVRILTYRVS
jgi:hypothetical protein